MRLSGFLKAPQTPWHEPNLHRHGIEIKCVAQVSAQNRGANLGHRANDSAESKSRLFDSVAACWGGDAATSINPLSKPRGKRRVSRPCRARSLRHAMRPSSA